ncbi:hypothetical protein K8Z61_13060 [Nocardioides sp. TRM66260-LWL]|uniref:hypothetical protein n=1 Tax=Nocardioides sp. TRM66260-LWL TaxID=2874478 RepID=UPI001CC6A3A4|nr:hypothetical protein [Nocardioides sp. TRM66260-LWL]MBZ5735427.1 hypothetical protein [Nocardioides sp. TRM66260-LWL]
MFKTPAQHVGTALIVTGLISLSACGGSGGAEAPSAEVTATVTRSGQASPESSPSASVETAPTYEALTKSKLEAALLTLRDMPVGYSQDADSESGDTDKTFCDYEPPFTEKVAVSRDFTKGGGLSSQFLSVGLRQFGDSDRAGSAFDALVKALDTCKGETFQGTKLVYAVMSAPKVGDDSIGIRITADGTTILQNFAVVGPTLVNVGGGGLMKADADEIAGLLEDQVSAYEDAAR